MTLNFTSLCDLVEKYLGGYNADGLIPTFVGLAEHRLQRECRLRSMERRATYVANPGVEAVPLPDKRVSGDWDVFITMREVSLRTSPPVNLAYIAPDVFTNLSGQSGLPKSYTIVGRDLLLAPAPDGECTILLTYYAQIPPLSKDQPTNDVLLTYPDLYLYATLLESVPYTRSSVPVETWAQYYQAAKEDARATDANARFGSQIAARAPRRY